MNREIKFRVWHPKTKTFLYKNFELGDGDDGYIGSDNNGDMVYVEDVIFQQFIGLYDSNYREIFEGDILDDIEYDTRHVVKYDDNLAAFIFAPTFYKDDRSQYHKDLGWPKEMDFVFTQDYIKSGYIIGNIFENPLYLK